MTGHVDQYELYLGLFKDMDLVQKSIAEKQYSHSPL